MKHTTPLSFSALILAIAFLPILRDLRAESPVDPLPPGNVPAWARPVNLSAVQQGTTLSFTLETADTIPKHITDTCQFQIVLRNQSEGGVSTASDPKTPTYLITCDVSEWDGSPWFATRVYSRFDKKGVPADTGRSFDWKISGKSFKVTFSLEGMEWSSVLAKGRVRYGNGGMAVTPDTGWISLTIDRTPLRPLKTRSSSRAVFTYPAVFAPTIANYDVLGIVDAAYREETELTLVTPIGGDSVRFIFNPFYGGAAIEGDPIYLGPGMWGATPLWFVYFHEMGHNFMNVSARFRQLYPLEMKLNPGPLPTNILFYEGWASLPAMYTFDAFERKGKVSGVRDSTLAHVLKEWLTTKSRFQKAWSKYKEKPVYTDLNPDIIDGMFLELQDRYGWSIFRKWSAIMRPVTKTLPLFDERLPGDLADLRMTRCTLTAAAFSAAAGSDLRSDFRKWAFPIDDKLFEKAWTELRHLTH